LAFLRPQIGRSLHDELDVALRQFLLAEQKEVAVVGLEEEKVWQPARVPTSRAAPRTRR